MTHDRDGSEPPRAGPGGPAQLFVTCLVDAFFPEVGEATADLIERAGFTVEFAEDQTCCGQPAFNVGMTEQARAMAAHTVRVLSETSGPIVIPSGSCADMLVHHVPGLLADHPLADAAGEVAARVRELTLFLHEQDAGADARCDGCVVTYHPSCHGLRGLGVREAPTALLAEVDGLELRELPDAERCCGFGGLFSVEMPEVSMEMLREKLEAIAASGAEVVTGTDVSCLMHIGGALRRSHPEVTVAHIALLLRGRLPDDEGSG